MVLKANTSKFHLKARFLIASLLALCVYIPNLKQRRLPSLTPPIYDAVTEV
jgi:hypothetical protein